MVGDINNIKNKRTHAMTTVSASNSDPSWKTSVFSVNATGVPCLILISPEAMRSAPPTSNPTVCRQYAKLDNVLSSSTYNILKKNIPIKTYEIVSKATYLLPDRRPSKPAPVPAHLARASRHLSSTSHAALPRPSKTRPS